MCRTADKVPPDGRQAGDERRAARHRRSHRFRRDGDGYRTHGRQVGRATRAEEVETMSGLVVASNRGPVSWREQDGELVPRRGFGGLVTALGGALQHEEGEWVSVALDDAGRRVAAEHGGEPFTVDADGSSYTLRLLDAGDRYDPYYNEVSNRLLWFTVHGLWGSPYEPSGVGWSAAWDDGYVPVNRAVADAVAAAAGDGREVFLQDYHLCLTPRMVRDAVPNARILHYVHTPWPAPEGLRRLPDRLVDELLRGLLAADVVAISSPAWAEHLRECATAFLGATRDGSAITLDGRRTVVADVVLGVDEADLTSSADSDEARRAGEDLDHEIGDRALLLRVDRSDPSKNILRGLRAYELLLERHPEHRGRVWHYAHINPSRQSVPEYAAYLDACREAAARIAERFGDGSITFSVTDDYPRAIAALQRYDVLLANPVVDGTNLVAKEGPVLNERDGVLVLSPSAGAATVLGEAALLVNPYDVETMAERLHEALTMPAEERRSRAQALAEAARIGSPEAWFAEQRRILREAVAARSHPAG
jgi:trehalose 6-phosphate synthase